MEEEREAFFDYGGVYLSWGYGGISPIIYPIPNSAFVSITKSMINAPFLS